jgi:hypothetical protein
VAEAGTVRQSAISVGLCTTGSLFREDAASEHRVGDGTCDVNKGCRVDGVNVVMFPSAALLLYPFNAAKPMKSIDPAWRV